MVQVQSPAETPYIYDVIVIGGGPSGSTTALYTARADLETLVLDKGLTMGALGMADAIANYPGVPHTVKGVTILEQMREQAQAFDAHFMQEKVLKANLKADPKDVWVSQGVYQGRAIVIATGAMGRASAVPGEERLVGRGVSYCATCDGAFFRDQPVAVVGGNDEALDEALFLTRFASRVHLLVPSAKLSASPDLGEDVRQHPKLDIHWSTRLKEILGQEQVEGVRVAAREGQEQMLSVAGVFLYLQGRQPITDFLGEQLDTTESGCLVVDESMQTSIPGVFAVGDVLCNHLKQTVVAAADGAIAAMAVRRYLSGRNDLRPDWSR